MPPLADPSGRSSVEGVPLDAGGHAKPDILGTLTLDWYPNACRYRKEGTFWCNGRPKGFHSEEWKHQSGHGGTGRLWILNRTREDHGLRPGKNWKEVRGFIKEEFDEWTNRRKAAIASDVWSPAGVSAAGVAGNSRPVQLVSLIKDGIRINNI